MFFGKKYGILVEKVTRKHIAERMFCMTIGCNVSDGIPTKIILTLEEQSYGRRLLKGKVHESTYLLIKCAFHQAHFLCA